MSNPTPAETLAAVLRVLTPEALITVRGRYVEHHYYSDSRDFDASDKNHLAHIVAMLDEGQRERFDLRMADITKGGAMEQDGRYPRVPASAVLTAPASVWLAALAVATGVK